MTTRPPRTEESAIRTLGGEQRSEFCTVTEAARMLGVSVSTVWRWVDARKLAAFRVGPKAIRIKRTDVEAAIQPIADRKKVDAMNAIDIGEEGAILPMTLEQAERGMAALAAGKELREAIRARRKGEPLSDSATIIRKAREERSGQI